MYLIEYKTFLTRICIEHESFVANSMLAKLKVEDKIINFLSTAQEMVQFSFS